MEHTIFISTREHWMLQEDIVCHCGTFLMEDKRFLLENTNTSCGLRLFSSEILESAQPGIGPSCNAQKYRLDLSVSSI